MLKSEDQIHQGIEFSNILEFVLDGVGVVVCSGIGYANRVYEYLYSMYSL